MDPRCLKMDVNITWCEDEGWTVTVEKQQNPTSFWNWEPNLPHPILCCGFRFPSTLKFECALAPHTDKLPNYMDCWSNFVSNQIGWCARCTYYIHALVTYILAALLSRWKQEANRLNLNACCHSIHVISKFYCAIVCTECIWVFLPRAGIGSLGGKPNSISVNCWYKLGISAVHLIVKPLVCDDDDELPWKWDGNTLTLK